MLPWHASQLGTAFDYLLRFELERRHPDFVTTKPWLPEAGLVIVQGEAGSWNSQSDARAIRRATRFMKQAKQDHAAFLETGEVTDSLLESVWRLAYLDRFYRIPPTTVETLPINMLERKEVHLGVGAKELRALLHAVPFKQGFTPQRRLALNPNFGDASRMIGGADADIILDNTVIDIKTTVEPKVPRGAFNQLVGYAALAELGGINDQPPQRLEHFKIYLSRYGVIQRFERNEVVNEERWPHFLEWLARRSRDALPTRQESADRILADYAERRAATA